MIVVLYIVPRPNVSVSSHLPPYNGTNFNLTGMIQMDMDVLDTDIATIWKWSLGETTLKIHNTTLCCQNNITFEPLTTYSSGHYNLQVTVQSLSNSLYHTESCSSTIYHLTVQRKLYNYNHHKQIVKHALVFSFLIYSIAIVCAYHCSGGMVHFSQRPL